MTEKTIRTSGPGLDMKGFIHEQRALKERAKETTPGMPATPEAMLETIKQAKPELIAGKSLTIGSRELRWQDAMLIDGFIRVHPRVAKRSEFRTPSGETVAGWGNIYRLVNAAQEAEVVWWPEEDTLDTRAQKIATITAQVAMGQALTYVGTVDGKRKFDGRNVQILVDTFSASTVLSALKQLNEGNRAKVWKMFGSAPNIFFHKMLELAGGQVMTDQELHEHVVDTLNKTEEMINGCTDVEVLKSWGAKLQDYEFTADNAQAWKLGHIMANRMSKALTRRAHKDAIEGYRRDTRRYLKLAREMEDERWEKLQATQQTSQGDDQ